jgi:hypothetical protein
MPFPEMSIQHKFRTLFQFSIESDIIFSITPSQCPRHEQAIPPQVRSPLFKGYSFLTAECHYFMTFDRAISLHADAINANTFIDFVDAEVY